MKKLLFIITIVYGVTAQAFNIWNFISSINTQNGSNFNKIKDSNRRKIVFFAYLLPMVEVENNKLNDTDIKELVRKYNIKNESKESLLSAIDTIPTSLVLVQAAIESNWWRSIFSKHYNNYFGLSCLKPSCEVVPKNQKKALSMKL